MENEKQTYTTRDIYLASTLVTLRFFMNGIDYQVEGERRLPVGYFNFEKTPELEQTARKFLQGQLAVEPRSFVTNLKSLKAEINNFYKSPKSNIKNPQ